MPNQLPKISITNDESSGSSECNSNDNEINYNQHSDAVTDVEDFDSHLGNSNSDLREISNTKLLLLPANAATDNDLTDVEDYNDSDGDEEEGSKIFPELKMSLHEFLQSGLQEQTLINNNIKQCVEIMHGNFIEAQNLNGVVDYLTDCEDFNTDSDIEEANEKSVSVNEDYNIKDQGRICVTDLLRMNKENDGDEFHDFYRDDVSEISGAFSALSDGDVNALMNRESEDELLEISAYDELCQIEYSGSSSDNGDWFEGVSNTSVPAIDVMFLPEDGHVRRASIPVSHSFRALLEVASNNEEVLTDIERLDDTASDVDSFDDDENDAKPIPRAVVLAVEDDIISYLTDIEDISCHEDCSELWNEIDSFRGVEFDLLPLAQREVIALKEDEYGDTITSAMPMNKEYRFGLCNHASAEELTDTEEYSCANDFNDFNINITPDNMMSRRFIEDGFTVINDKVKQLNTRRTELHAKEEPITDIEEIFIAGTSKKKRLKSRSTSKNKMKLLEAKNTEYQGSTTDIEDMDFSDSTQMPRFKIKLYRQYNHRQNHQEANEELIKTDIEDFVDDDSTHEIDAVDGNASILKFTDNYIANCVNFEHSAEFDGIPKNFIGMKLNKPETHVGEQMSFNQNLTDNEEILMTSDADADIDNIRDSIKEIDCSSSQLKEILDDNCTTVHEKAGNCFNVEYEKLHIKGLPDFREAHTDVEYVESDESAVIKGGE